MTPEEIIAAHNEVARLTHELDITNADHIALWLEANMDDSPLAWLACRIIEAHEAILTARIASARAEGRREGIEEAAKVADQAYDGFAPVYSRTEGYNSATRYIAKQIRALAEKQP